MKKLVLTLALILCGYAVSNASILTKQSVELAVGSNPVSILENPSDGMIHIFCAGIDANDNNVYDEGEDEKPSWWTYNPAGSSVEPTMVKEFDNYFVSPFKPMMYGFYGNKGAVRIPFACTKVSGEYLGQTKHADFGFDLFDELFGSSLNDSEYLVSRLQQSDDKKLSTIEIIRTNGNDRLVYIDNQTGDNYPITLNGDVTDFTFVDLDGDGTDEVAILVDNKTLAYYKVGTNIELIKEMGLTDISGYTGTFGYMYSNENYVYTTFENSNTLIQVTTDLEGNIERFVIDFSSIDNLENPSSFYPNDDKVNIITNNKNDLMIFGYEVGLPEMHRTALPTDFVYTNENTAYITSGNKVLIYDITNKLNRDFSYNSHVYFGYQPMDIFDFEDKYYSVNLGVDFNFDGNIEEAVGDQKPSVFSFTLQDKERTFDNITKQTEFDFPINFPLNTNISSDGDITIPSGNSVHYYNVEDNEVYESFDAGMYVSTAFRVLDYLVLGQRDYANGKSYVRIKKGDFIDVSTEVGANVVDCIVYQNNSGFGVVSLSEGNFGQPDAKINIIKLSTMGIGDNTAIDVGTGGNSIVANADQSKAAVVMNGSHEIHILNLITGEIDLTFSTGTSGYGGPRDAKFQDDKLYVSTYSNKILVFDSNNGNQLSSITIDGNSEGIAITSNYLLAANINYSNYQPSNRIFAYDLDKITSVEETKATQQTIRVYPHPVSNDFHLVSDDLAGTNDIAIINSQGKIVATHSGSSNGTIALNTDALGLVAGNYTAVINGTRAVRFVVIK